MWGDGPDRRPSLTCFVSERVEHGRRLVVVSVPQGIGPCSSTAGMATRDSKPVSPCTRSTAQVLAARGVIDWSADAAGGHRPARTAGDRADASTPPPCWPRQARSATPDAHRTIQNEQGQDRLRAGALLLSPADAPSRSPSATSYQYRPATGVEATNRLRGREPMLAAIELSHRGPLSSAPSRTAQPQRRYQLSLLDYPSGAVRWLIVNGLIHRSYETHGTVDIEHTGDQLVISESPRASSTSHRRHPHLPSTPRNRCFDRDSRRPPARRAHGTGVDRAYYRDAQKRERAYVPVGRPTRPSCAYGRRATSRSYASWLISLIRSTVTWTFFWRSHFSAASAPSTPSLPRRDQTISCRCPACAPTDAPMHSSTEPLQRTTPPISPPTGSIRTPWPDSGGP